MVLNKRIAASLCLLFTAAHIATVSPLRGEYGWQPPETHEPCKEFPWRSQAGVTRLLYKDWIAVYGSNYIPRNQGNSPSCVGHATAAAVDILSAVEIRAGEPERPIPARTNADVIYGLSRAEVGGLTPPSMGGSYNLWAVKALKQYGTIPSLDYPFLGYDLRRDHAHQFSYGVPASLERLAKLHPVRDYICINSYEDCRDAIYHGSPVIVGSDIGFGDGQRTRDRDGFLNRPRRFFPSKWNHSMVIIGVADTGRRGCLILNSWGTNWVVGPKRFGDEPDGSFWVDAHIIDQMLKQEDSYAIRGFQGYPSYRLN